MVTNITIWLKSMPDFAVTVECSTHQRGPIVLAAQFGNPLEADDAKPTNRDKGNR